MEKKEVIQSYWQVNCCYGKHQWI